MSSDVIDDIRVKLVVIAKDESAYIPEWVHHHLYFGFDAIEIYVNRTTDNSADMLSLVCQHNPQVDWRYADWIDMCPGQAKQQMQFIVYAKAIEEARRKGDFSHIFFLDMDEFWCTQGFKTSIKDCIREVGVDKAIFFEWVNDLGNLNEFSTLPQRLEGALSPLGKTLLPVNAGVTELRHHVPLLAKNVNYVLVDGVAVENRKRAVQALTPELNSLKSAFIYHRAHRSELEYVSLLYRGRPGNNFKYKNNRTGLPKLTKKSVSVDFPSDGFNQYTESLKRFWNEGNFDEQYEQAKAFVYDRYQESLSNMAPSIRANYADMTKIFKGVHIPQVIEQFQQYRKTEVNKSPNNAERIRDFAIDAASQDLDEAIALMEHAQKLRPKGPKIRQRLETFRRKKAKLEQQGQDE